MEKLENDNRVLGDVKTKVTRNGVGKFGSVCLSICEGKRDGEFTYSNQ